MGQRRMAWTYGKYETEEKNTVIGLVRTYMLYSRLEKKEYIGMILN